MALRLGNNRRKPGHYIPHIISGLALVVALAILGTWLYIGYRMDHPPDKDDTLPSYSEEEPDLGRCLLILNTGDNAHYVLVQTDPAKQVISVLDIPAELAVENTTLKRTTNKKQAIEKALNLPVDHHIQMDSKGIQQFVSQTDGLIFTLPEAISYQDENGNTVRLSAEERSLTGPQISAILSYTKWEDKETAQTIAGQLVAAALDQYLDKDHTLIYYFRLFTQTSLRIDNFNDYKTELDLLASANDGTLCQVYTIDGKEEDGRFFPDTEALRKNKDLYQN